MQKYVHRSCVMLTKWVFFKFSRPGNSLSKFCASERTFYEVSIMSASCDCATLTSLVTMVFVISEVFLSYSQIFNAT